MQQTELVADAIVGPAFELEEGLQIRGSGDAIEQAHDRIPTRHEPGRRGPADQ